MAPHRLGRPNSYRCRRDVLRPYAERHREYNASLRPANSCLDESNVDIDGPSTAQTAECSAVERS